MRTRFSLALAGAAFLASAPAVADTFDFQYSINTADLHVQDSGGAYNDWVEITQVAGPTDPFLMSVGDQVNATISLDHTLSFTTRGVYQAWFQLFGAADGSWLRFGEDETMTFYNDGVAVVMPGNETDDIDEVAPDFSGYVSGHSSGFTFRFDTVELHGTLKTLKDMEGNGLTSAQMAPVSSIMLVYSAPVPEPATYAAMILGFGIVGGAIRRRGSVTATA